MTRLSMTGPIGLVIGSEARREPARKRKCDMTAAIPMKGDRFPECTCCAGILMYEILRQREL